MGMQTTCTAPLFSRRTFRTPDFSCFPFEFFDRPPKVRSHPTIGRPEIVRGRRIGQGNIRQIENAGPFLRGQIRDFGFSPVWHELELLSPHGADEVAWSSARRREKGKGQKPSWENVSRVP
jgi:hypothetical protein